MLPLQSSEVGRVFAGVAVDLNLLAPPTLGISSFVMSRIASSTVELGRRAREREKGARRSGRPSHHVKQTVGFTSSSLNTCWSRHPTCRQPSRSRPGSLRWSRLRQRRDRWTYRSSNGKAAPKIVPPRLRIPCGRALVPIPKRSTSPRAASTLNRWIV